jgi:hypothetical protein
MTLCLGLRVSTPEGIQTLVDCLLNFTLDCRRMLHCGKLTSYLTARESRKKKNRKREELMFHESTPELDLRHSTSVPIAW